MARSRKKSYSSKNKTTYSNTTKKTRAYRRNTKPRLRSSIFDKKLNEYNNRFVEDRRRYNPNKNYQPQTRSGSTARIVTTVTPAKQSNRTTTLNRLQARFAAPERVMICVRRKQRREVIHALKLSGKSGQRRPTRSRYSNINCK